MGTDGIWNSGDKYFHGRWAAKWLDLRKSLVQKMVDFIHNKTTSLGRGLGSEATAFRT